MPVEQLNFEKAKGLSDGRVVVPTVDGEIRHLSAAEVCERAAVQLREAREQTKELTGKLDIIVREGSGEPADALAVDYGGTGWEKSTEVQAVRAQRAEQLKQAALEPVALAEKLAAKEKERAHTHRRMVSASNQLHDANTKIAALRSKLEHTVTSEEWFKLLAEIAKVDPTYKEHPDEPDPYPDDPAFQEEYDPWQGLRMIVATLERGGVPPSSDEYVDAYIQKTLLPSGLSDEKKGLVSEYLRGFWACVKPQIEALESKLCDECDGDGWVEERPGRRPCICVEEKEAYRELHIEKEKVLQLLGSALIQLHAAGQDTFAFRLEMSEKDRKLLVKLLGMDKG